MIRKAAVICFTENGCKTAEKVRKCLSAHKISAALAKKYSGAPDSITELLTEWTGRQFGEQDALVFVGAAGIAVRAVAPFVTSKVMDPAVLVMDEQGRYCIPILSGHLGGANELAELIGRNLGAVPVITTATDLNGKWAVDVFAGKNGLMIREMEKAKEISARLLAGGHVSVYIEESCGMIRGDFPDGVRRWSEPEDGKLESRLSGEAFPESFENGPDIVIGISDHPAGKGALHLIPKAVVLGIGCRKGMPAQRLEERIRKVLEQNGIFPESVRKAASADLKREEEGLLRLCERYGWEFETFSPEVLKGAAGEFQASRFVEEVTGVDNVCERSAVCGCRGGKLIIPKQAGDGITVAAAVQRWGISFE